MTQPAAVADTPMRPRITSGNADADRILGGGFPANSINIIMGHPGTGKTVFAEQLLFHHAKDETPRDREGALLYLTTLSEPMSKVVSYVQQFSFYDETKLGGTIQYADISEELRRDGPRALIARVQEEIRTSSPRIIIVDSFRALHDLAISGSDTRHLISELAGLLSAYDTTAFLLGEYTIEDVSRYPEFAVADSIIELARNALGTRDERYFRVLKLRGSGYLEGQHAFRITRHGLRLYPRLISPKTPESYDMTLERVTSGVPGLDPVMGGGMWSGTTSLVIGPTGSGKTTMGLQFVLAAAKRGEPSLYVNFQENPIQLQRPLRNLGWNPEAPGADALQLLYVSPVELQIDSIIGEIFAHIRQSGLRRVVIDAVGDLATASDPRRLHDYLYALGQHFAVNGVTSLIMLESPDQKWTRTEFAPTFSYMSDNVIVLSYSEGDVAERKLRVIKMRNSSHDRRAHQMEIDASGLKIL